MMTSDQPELCRLERPIEIYENERLWIGRGFSKAGLLPTERGPYSTQDGSLSWKSMREASLALLRGDVLDNNKEWYTNGKTTSAAICRRGWSFHEENSNDPSSTRSELDDDDDYECSTTQDNNGNNTGSSDTLSYDEYCGFVPCKGAEDGPTDENGWQYFPDFKEQSLLYPNRKRGLLDFVRRRKLRRMAMFRPDHFLPRDVYNKCDYCDSKAVQVLSDAMLDALSLASLFAYGPANPEKVTDAQVIPLKAKLIDTLEIGRNWRSDSKKEEGEEDTTDIDNVRERLCTFAEKSVGKPGPIMHLLNPDVDQNIQAIQPLRKKVIAKYFTDEERISLARLLIKDIDRDAHQLHCENETCASSQHAGSNHGNSKEVDDLTSCPFQFIPCPNYKCTIQMSKKYAKEHDDECGYKLVPCPSGCGMEVARNDMHVHVTTRCSLRQAECPLSIVGCTAIVQAADVTKHLNQHADTHFMLLSARMIEYQKLFQQFDTKIKMLEEKNAKLERELARSTALLSTKNESNVISNDLKKVTKRLHTLEKKVDHDRRSHTK